MPCRRPAPGGPQPRAARRRQQAAAQRQDDRAVGGAGARQRAGAEGLGLAEVSAVLPGHHPGTVVREYSFTQAGAPWRARRLGFTGGGKSYQLNIWYAAAAESAESAYDPVTDSFRPL